MNRCPDWYFCCGAEDGFDELEWYEQELAEFATRQVSADECSHVAAYWRSQEPTPCDCGFCTVPDSGEFRCYYEQRAREFELAASWVAPRDW